VPISDAYLAEHQAPTERAPGYNPTDEEQKTIRLAEGLFSEAKRGRRAHDMKWAENYKMYRGKQWPTKRPSYRHSEVLNYIFSEVQNVIVLLTDNRPTIEILPEDPTDYDFAEIINQVIKSKWDAKNYAAVLAENITDASIFGTSVGHVPYKPELEQGLGDFKYESEDPFHVFPDPCAKSEVNDEYCGYFILARPESVKKLKEKYPHVADFLRSDLSDLSQDLEREGLDEIAYKSPSDNRVLTDSQIPGEAKPNQALEICIYLKSNETTEEEIEGELDELTGLKKKLYQTKKKYPNGRKIVVVNGVLCEDIENPYEDGKFPFARLVDYALPRQFWGTGEVEQLTSPQRIVNKLISYVLDVLTIMGNPIWIVDNNSGIDTDNLTNQPGLKVEKNPGTEARRESGVGLQPFVLETLQFMANNVFQKLAPTGEVSKGVAPSENASGIAIEQLQEAAQTKIRGKGRNVEFFLKDIGDLMVSRILQFYTVPRIIRLTSNEESSKYFRFVINENVDESGEVQKFAEVSDFQEQIDPITGETRYVEGMPRQIPLKSRLDVRVNVSSSLPFAKDAKYARAEKLFDKQIIDTEEYLTEIEYPNREKVLNRLRKQAQQMAMQPPMSGDPNGTANAAPVPGPIPSPAA